MFILFVFSVVIDHSPRLQRLHRELASLMNNRVLREYKAAFEDEDSRRREWAVRQASADAQFQSHPLAPRADSAPTLSLAGPTKIVISWDDGADADDRA